jgi:hypothetical protein
MAILVVSINSGSFPDTNGKRPRRAIGAMTADDPAKSTIKPTATGTFPFATAVSGGP